MGLLSYIAWPERDRLYLEKKYCDANRVIIPQDLIINPVNKIALPVYLAMYMMDNSVVDISYNVPVTLKNICDSVRIFKDIQLRKAHYDIVSDAILWLADRKYITIANFSRKATTRFTYRFTEDLRDVIRIDATGKRQQFLYITVKELNSLLTALCLSDKSWKTITEILTVYMYLKLKQGVWQHKQTEKSHPAWVGYLKDVVEILHIPYHKLSPIIAWLKAENIILPVYGVKEKSGQNISKTIIVFLLCCDTYDVHKVVVSVQALIKKTNQNAHWYPVKGNYKSAEFIDEAALDVVCDENEVY